ncbi:glycoside hydrolase family 13 protein [Lactobacillus psittaci]|uniref:Neopullulanase n=1 Tax=Lactobacillus psittaci DSM 15354 TaxID=1122152 RepID=A0A0R1RYW9_9LACO|nr:glycoside hydrolase family 13 protein [Lactobacillus psittaci]KRL62160.1 neopullulanase [Lactobacillus psittaci DSM 15354]
MQEASLRHRPESEDCFVIDKNHLRLRFHTAKADVKKVIVHYLDSYYDLKTAQKQEMTKIGSGQVADYYMTTLELPLHRCQYTFEVVGQDGSHIIYGDRGIREYNDSNLYDYGQFFKVPYFHEIDMAKTPAWVKETVWYQIFPERFNNGDKNNDPVGTKPWNPADHPGREDYYGGDLQGVLDKLDYLQELGINGLYFCPIFKASSNHKYDTIDYLEIDPDFGDKKLFKKLVDEAHKRGMHVMLDAVFNHLGYQSKEWQDVVKHGRDSKYFDWFHINYLPVTPFKDPSKGEGMPPYDTFAFEPHMPKLNTANPEVQKYLLNIATYWAKEFHIDAWRLDVANEVDHHFWKKFHAALMAINPDFYIVGEVWHSSQPWLNGDEFTGVMNYPYTQQIEDHFLTGKISAEMLTQVLFDQLMLYRDCVNSGMLNMLDSHDTARLLTLADENQDKALNALAFELIQPGSPSIYYGTEMAMTGGNDPDCRKPMDWDKAGNVYWQKVHDLIEFRRKHAAVLSQSDIEFAVEDDLIEVKHGQLVAYFNTSEHEVKIDKQASVSNGYQNGILSPNGYILCE